MYSVTGSRRLLTRYPTDDCYKKFFVGGQAPTGFRPPDSGDIKYICQQIEESSDETLYVTMFDESIGIAVYAGYGLSKASAQQMGIFPRIQKWFTDKGCIQRLTLDLSFCPFISLLDIVLVGIALSS